MKKYFDFILFLKEQHTREFTYFLNEGVHVTVFCCILKLFRTHVPVFATNHCTVTTGTKFCCRLP